MKKSIYTYVYTKKVDVNLMRKAETQNTHIPSLLNDEMTVRFAFDLHTKQ